MSEKKSLEDLKSLIDKIRLGAEDPNSLKKGKIGKLVNNRIKEFKNINKKSINELFNEMCFCILTANFNAEKSIKIQNEIGLLLTEFYRATYNARSEVVPSTN